MSIFIGYLVRQLSLQIEIEDLSSPNPLYHCLGTIRCLQLREKNPEKWTKFNELESLENQRRGSAQWKADLESVGEFIPK